METTKQTLSKFAEECLQSFAARKGYVMRRNYTALIYRSDFSLDITYRGRWASNAIVELRGGYRYGRKAPWRKMTYSYEKNCALFEELIAKARAFEREDEEQKKRQEAAKVRHTDEVERVTVIADKFNAVTEANLEHQKYSWGRVRFSNENKYGVPIKVKLHEDKTHFEFEVPTALAANMYIIVRAFLKAANEKEQE